MHACAVRCSAATQESARHEPVGKLGQASMLPTCIPVRRGPPASSCRLRAFMQLVTPAWYTIPWSLSLLFHLPLIIQIALLLLRGHGPRPFAPRRAAAPYTQRGPCAPACMPLAGPVAFPLAHLTPRQPRHDVQRMPALCPQASSCVPHPARERPAAQPSP